MYRSQTSPPYSYLSAGCGDGLTDGDSEEEMLADGDTDADCDTDALGLIEGPSSVKTLAPSSFRIASVSSFSR